MAAGSSSGEESAAGTSPEPAQQEQAAPMEAMLAMILQKVGGIQDRHRHSEHFELDERDCVFLLLG